MAFSPRTVICTIAVIAAVFLLAAFLIERQANMPTEAFVVTVRFKPGVIEIVNDNSDLRQYCKITVAGRSANVLALLPNTVVPVVFTAFDQGGLTPALADSSALPSFRCLEPSREDARVDWLRR